MRSLLTENIMNIEILVQELNDMKYKWWEDESLTWTWDEHEVGQEISFSSFSLSLSLLKTMIYPQLWVMQTWQDMTDSWLKERKLLSSSNYSSRWWSRRDGKICYSSQAQIKVLYRLLWGRSRASPSGLSVQDCSLWTRRLCVELFVELSVSHLLSFLQFLCKFVKKRDTQHNYTDMYEISTRE